MHISHFRIAATLTGALALSSCLAVEGDPLTEEPLTIQPLPAEYSSAVPGGIEGYFAEGGGWEITTNGQVQTVNRGSVTLANAMMYHTVNNQWTINIDGADFLLAYDGSNGFYGGRAAPLNVMLSSKFTMPIRTRHNTAHSVMCFTATSPGRRLESLILTPIMV